MREDTTNASLRFHAVLIRFGNASRCCLLSLPLMSVCACGWLSVIDERSMTTALNIESTTSCVWGWWG